MKATENWEELANSKRQSIIDKIPKEWIFTEVPSPDSEPNALEFLDRMLPKDEKNITGCTITQLVDKIKKKELTSLEITKAFCHRAALSHQLTNCLSEVFFEKAYERAKELDLIFEATGELVGELHGIPVSLKDQFNVEGVETCCGFVSKLGSFQTKDQESDVVKILRQAGAIFYVKTTVPMGMMSYETFSNLLGHTLNGINRKLSSGGSSGGEGALISTRGSIVGIGTDLGGSLRTPAGFNGIHSIRCSTGRFPARKGSYGESGSVLLLSVCGPLAQDLEDLRIVSKVLIDAKPWEYDARTYPIEWKNQFDTLPTSGKYVFGMMKWDGVVQPHPPISRCIESVKRKLIADGHEVVDLEPQHHREILDVINGIYRSGASLAFKNEVSKSGEPLSYSYKENFKHSTVPYTCIEYWELAKDRYKYQQLYDEYWNNTSQMTSSGKKIDAIISPLWGSTSFVPGKPSSSPSTYTRWLNIIDYSTVVIPVSKVDKSIELKNWGYTPINALDKVNFEHYDLDLFDGTPISIQLSTRRYEEEKALFLAKVVSSSIN